MTTTVEVTPAAPEPNGHQPAAAGPLAGLRVLEMGSLVAGPFCTRLLAEFGAEVIEIETDGHPTTGHADVLERAQTTYGV
jgi:crotonobetainyl-CoA:carnitine CoA-transferase CaiB-like acyl-CoA transferase